MVVRHSVGDGNWTLVLREEQVLLTTKPSLQPQQCTLARTHARWDTLCNTRQLKREGTPG